VDFLPSSKKTLELPSREFNAGAQGGWPGV